MSLRLKLSSHGSILLLGVFGLGLLIRGLPEFLSGPYPVGYDLLAGYAPAMSTLPETYPLVLFGWQTSPLAIFILWFFWIVSHIDLFLFLKIAGPIFYGLLTASFYYMLTKGLRWDRKKSLITALLLLLQPAVLRNGWDQLRLMLGFVFLFLLLAETEFDIVSAAQKKPFTVGVLSFLIILSQQLAAVVFFVVVLWQFVKSDWGKSSGKALLVVLPAVMVFGLQVYFSFLSGSHFSAHFTPIQLPTGSGIFAFTNYFLSDPRFINGDYFSILAYVGSLSLYVVVPLIFFVVKGFFKDRVFFPMISWLLFASYSIVIFPWFALSFYWFWMFLLPIPMTVYAVHGLEKWGVLGDRRHRRKLAAGMMVLFVIGFGYASSLISVGYPLAYSYMPPGLVKSCVDFEDIPDIQKAFDWANLNLPINATVVIPEKFQGFSVMILREDLLIRVAPALLKFNEVIHLTENWSFFAIYYTEEVGNNGQSISQLVKFGSIGVFKTRT